LYHSFAETATASTEILARIAAYCSGWQATAFARLAKKLATNFAGQAAQTFYGWLKASEQVASAMSQQLIDAIETRLSSLQLRVFEARHSVLRLSISSVGNWAEESRSVQAEDCGSESQSR